MPWGSAIKFFLRWPVGAAGWAAAAANPACVSVLADIGPLTSPWLSDWSSLIGPIEGIGAFSAGYVLLRRHNCHVQGCWRIGRRAVGGTEYIVCHHHHPSDKPSHRQVLDAARRVTAAAEALEANVLRERHREDAHDRRDEQDEHTPPA